MLKNIMLCAILSLTTVYDAPVARAVETPAYVSLSAGATAALPAQPSENYAVVFGGTAADTGVRGATPLLLTSVMTWLATNFDLPAVYEHPRIEFAAPMKLIAMRYKGILPESWREDRIRDPAVQTAQLREVVAVYNDTTRTIYLPESWTGKTASEQSVLVHEMVHHLQNLGKLKYECPAAREKLAYEAQREWLRLAGLDLETEFGIDMMTLLISSVCMN